MDLPEALRSGLEAYLGSIRPSSVADASRDLSRRYRERHARRAGAFLNSSGDIAAYAASRLPATFGAVGAALAQTRLRLPDWQPVSLLDAGAGPGTAAWAALQLWPEIGRITLLERDAGMLDLGKTLGASGPAALQSACWLAQDLTSGSELERHDLVVAAYVLGELPESDRQSVIERLWNAAGHALVLVEPGTPSGYGIILQARDSLRAIGGSIAAPCPHNRDCPMAGNDWCHFAARVPRGRLHRTAKGGSLSYEDEKYSYVAISRAAPETIWARVVRHPQTRPGHIHVELCTDEGLQHRTITRKHKEAYRLARDLKWGDPLESPP